MKTIETKVYTFDELSDAAKEKARDWIREHVAQHEWWDSIYDDAKTIGLEITSFDLDRNRHARGSLTKDALDVAELIKKNHGKHCDTYNLATTFLKAYAVTPNANEDHQQELFDNFERDLLEEYSIMLQHEYEFMYTNEYVDDMIEANEYTFTSNGKRFG